MDKPIKKPSNWSFIQYNNNDKIDLQKSFFVGDALGRFGDWSDSDKQFAINCGIKHYSPEEIFGDDVSELIPEKAQLFIPNSNQELIIMVGYPGSGKSTWIKHNLANNSNYQILEGDQLKTEAKIKKELIKCLDLEQSVVIDATNPSLEKRKVFIEIAQARHVPIRIIELTTSMGTSFNRNNQRENIVPKVVFYLYRKKYQKPFLSEGVKQIIEI
tara:strand:+ start:557 stop:1201 length:645 start_codon:yes stop_codon:yes gene_type:complete